MDDSDVSIYDAVAREMWEETGLRVKRFVEFLGLQKWGEAGKTWGKFSYLVEVDQDEATEVRVQEGEHDAFLWVGEEDVRTILKEEVDGVKFVVPEVGDAVLKGFRIIGKKNERG